MNNFHIEFNIVDYVKRLLQPITSRLPNFRKEDLEDKKIRVIKIVPFPNLDEADTSDSIKINRELNQLNKFKNNKVLNTKYSLLTFLPIFFWEQFGRFMNFYFLLIACLQLIKQLTPINPITTWTPLIIIFSISGIKEIYDDYKRWKADQQFNERYYSKLRSDGSLKPIQSGQIKVGDIVKISQDEEIPCDLVLLKSDEAYGEAYLLTSNLDGESNLKTIHCPKITMEMELDEFCNLNGIIECPQPNAHLYNFDARLILDGNIIPLNPNQLLLQGTILKNTKFVYGVAVYTGLETKLGLNKGNSHQKLTILDLQIERASILVFILQLLLVLFLGTIGNRLQFNEFIKKHDYLYYNHHNQQFEDNFINHITIPLRMLLLLSLVIPISLKVSMDLTKFMCSCFIGWDIHMLDETRGPAIPKNTSIPDELGQIEYIMTDKTGTLTENIMVFKCCSIAGKSYIASSDIGRLSYSGNCIWNLILDKHIQQLFKSLKEPNIQLDPYHYKLLKFFEVLSLCHKIIPKFNETKNQMEYKGNSPDEEALVEAANKVGFEFIQEQNKILSLKVGNLPLYKYKLLDILEFSSNRKRMSIILQRIEPFCDQDSPILVLTKGADDTLLPLCQSNDILDLTEQHLLDYASMGLRTLTIAYKQITREEYISWKKEHQKAITAINEREELIEQSYCNIEHSFELLGCTGIEDKLQTNVPTTIASLRKAGIKIWMLTGDKLITAIQIGKSCHLLPSDNGNTVILSANELDPNLLLNKIEFEIKNLDLINNIAHINNNNNQQQHPITPILHHNELSQPILSLVLDGQCLKWILENITLKTKFLKLALQAHTVICCRATPKQKGEMVDMIKSQGKVTLAIGDGGNDVRMIQRANIGIGLRGREGLQASRACDISISRFYHLNRLILVHGRYSLHRVKFVALYCFYKSLFVSTLQAGYQLFNGFSGSSLLTTYSLSLYNILYTGLPILFYVLDKDIEENILLNEPKLYQFTNGRDPHYLFVNSTFKWFGWAILQGLITLFLSVFFYSVVNEMDNTIIFDAPHSGLSLSFMAYSIVVVTVQLTIAIYTNHFTYLNMIVVFGTILTYFITTYLASVEIPLLKMYEIAGLFYQSKFWLTLILSVTILIVPFWINLFLSYFVPGKDPNKINRLSAVLLNKKSSRRNTMNHQNHNSFNGLNQLIEEGDIETMTTSLLNNSHNENENENENPWVE
ncbi:phospholipid-translocating P-type ATPase [Neoconidiobolus thromboides FSU 785]|nr:phospholipid-translocating P-type ATPase [Neoconidiobolus thromboides FSU 785]